MRPTLHIQIPRLYIFVILIAVVFTVVNLAILSYGSSVILWISGIYAWVGVILLALIGSLLIGMYISYRVLALRSFTPFEKEMMEMRVEVSELKRTAEEIRAKFDTMPGCEPPAKVTPGKEGGSEPGAK